jgi:hypothetical protein
MGSEQALVDILPTIVVAKVVMEGSRWVAYDENGRKVGTGRTREEAVHHSHHSQSQNRRIREM